MSVEAPLNLPWGQALRSPSPTSDHAPMSSKRRPTPKRRYQRTHFKPRRFTRRPRQRAPLNMLDLFAGIGGFALGARLAGVPVVSHFYSEIDPYAQQVYTKNFPTATALGDVRSIDGQQLRRAHPGRWLLCGGFPCQDLSYSGFRRGIAAGQRSGLWWEMHRVIRELQPDLVIAENVPGLQDRGLDRVLLSLADIGFDAEWDVVSAAEVGAPHLRKRLWIVAYPHCDDIDPTVELSARGGDLAEHGQPHCPTDGRRAWPTWAEAQAAASVLYSSRVCRVADGVPAVVDRLKCVGNAVVPQVVARVMGHGWRRVENRPVSRALRALRAFPPARSKMT